MSHVHMCTIFYTISGGEKKERSFLNYICINNYDVSRFFPTKIGNQFHECNVMFFTHVQGTCQIAAKSYNMRTI